MESVGPAFGMDTKGVTLTCLQRIPVQHLLSCGEIPGGHKLESSCSLEITLLDQGI